MHKTLSVIALIRPPGIWHSSFRDVKGQGFQVNDFLYQQHQLTCTEESHSPKPGRCKRLTCGKRNRTRFDHARFLWVPGEMSFQRISLTQDETPLPSCKIYSNIRNLSSNPTLTILFKIAPHFPTSSLLTLLFFPLGDALSFKLKYS